MHNNSCEIRKVNNGLNNRIRNHKENENENENENEKENEKEKEKEKDFMNNSAVMVRRKINNNYKDIYYPKHVSPDLLLNENEYDVSRFYIRDPPELLRKNNFMNNNIPYKKMNIRYQKMYFDNDLNSEYKESNIEI